MSRFVFGQPLFLVLIPFVILVFTIRARRHRPLALIFSLAQDSKDLVSLRARMAGRVWVFRMAALFCLVLAMSRPQKEHSHTTINTEGLALEMVVDVSGSMRAMDFMLEGERVNRLAVVKEVFSKFVLGDDDLLGRANDTVGIVAFGGYPTSVCPLTLDHGALTQVLQGIRIPDEIYDARGQLINGAEFQTALGDAIALASARLRDSTADSKIMILLTDGENTAGDLKPLEAAQIASHLGIRIYTIGVGQSGVAPFPAVDFLGRRVLRQVRVRMDEKTLRAIAHMTGGQYFRARDTEGLRTIYKDIDQLEKTEIESEIYAEYEELYHWPLCAGLALLVFELLLGLTWLRVNPES